MSGVLLRGVKPEFRQQCTELVLFAPSGIDDDNLAARQGVVDTGPATIVRSGKAMLQVMASVLIVFPLGAAAVGGVFLYLFSRRRSRLSLLVACLWILYAVYESLMYFRVLCSGECNIRIDLLLIYPLLLVLSVLAVVFHISAGVSGK